MARYYQLVKNPGTRREERSLLVLPDLLIAFLFSEYPNLVGPGARTMRPADVADQINNVNGGEVAIITVEVGN